MSIVPAPSGAVVPIRRSSVGSSKRQKAVQEDHFVVQVPDDVAERLRAGGAASTREQAAGASVWQWW